MSRPGRVAKAQGGEKDQSGASEAPSNATEPGTTPPAEAGTLPEDAGAVEAVSQAPLGPPSLHWPDEPLDPFDERILRRKDDPRARIGSRYVWVNPDDRKAALQVTSDFLYHAIHDFFVQEAQKIKGILGQQPPIPDDKTIQQAVQQAMDEYDWTPWYEVLMPQTQKILENAFLRGASQTWDGLRHAEISLTWDAVSPKARYFARQRAGELVGMHVNDDGSLVPAKDPKMRVDSTTRLKLNAWIEQQLQEGKTWQEVADLLVDDAGRIGFPYMSDWRARRIARTEAAFAYNRGQISSLREAGFSTVEVIDGTQDEICRPVNHQKWTLAQAEANPLGHPHCSRHFLPVVDDNVRYRKESMEPPDSFTMPAEAEAWLRNKYPDLATDLSQVHPELLAPLVKEIDRLFTRYPYVAKMVTYIGQYTDQLGEQIQYEIPEDAKEEAYAFAGPIGQIWLNPKFLRDPKLLRADLKGLAKQGWLAPEAATNPAYVLTHEFGHQMQWWLQDIGRQGYAFEPFVTASGYGLVSETERRLTERMLANPISRYAATDPREAFAEAFAQYEMLAQKGKSIHDHPAVAAVAWLLEHVTPGRLYMQGQWRSMRVAPDDQKQRIREDAERWDMA